MFVGFEPSKVVFRISQPSTVSQISLNIGIFWHFLKKNKLMVDTKQSRIDMVPDLWDMNKSAGTGHSS